MREYSAFWYAFKRVNLRTMFHPCKMYFFVTVIFLITILFLPNTEAIQINVRGAGASFPSDVYQSWMPSYRANRQKFVDVVMSYEDIGSGEGKRKILARDESFEYVGLDSLLSEQELQNNLDLIIFPTMAGGTVLVYNLPGCADANNHLNLSREHVVGIYNGTYRFWNDTTLQRINPKCVLPDAQIRVIARHDSSGTTGMFTEALSSFSPEWKSKHGVFSAGVDETTEKPKYWNESVLYLYGKTNAGMMGLVMSLKYSIGYVSVSTAISHTYARIQNRYGRFTLPGKMAIQVTMDSHNAEEKLTSSLADGPLPEAYPIASYTYLVIYSTTSKCDSLKELIRYVDWFLTTQSAKDDCERKNMVPLTSAIVTRIQNEVLKKVTCNSSNVWNAVQTDIMQENYQEEPWKLPVSVSIPILLILVFGLLAYILYQRFKLMRMIENDEWNILIEDIVFFEDKQLSGGKSKLSALKSINSFRSINDIPEGQEILSQILQWPGKWKGNVVGIRLTELRELRHVTRELKKKMLWMRDSLRHANVLQFYGLTELETERYVIGEYCHKGSVQDILRNEKYNLNNDFKLSLAADIASGMAFLHNNNVIHGSLSCSCCLIDSRWTVKIADWEFWPLLTTLSPKISPLLTLRRRDDQVDTHAAAVKSFWVAPEIVKSEFMLTPTPASDVYSFAIVLQEIYTREDPYVEHANSMTPQQVLRAVYNNNLRPEPTDDIPVRIRQTMEIAWADNPFLRPSFDQIVKMLRQNRKSRKTTLDSMMEAMEDYAHHLEERISERSSEVMLIKRKLELLLNDIVPQRLVTRLIDGQGTHENIYNSMGVVMIKVLDLDSALRQTSPRDLIVLISDLCDVVNSVVQNYGAYRAVFHGATQTILVGLETETTFLDQRCLSAAQLAVGILDSITKLAPLSYGVNVTSLSVCAGLHVGNVVTGVVGAIAPKLFILGEGIETTRALLACSEPGRIRASEKVCSHLEKIDDFVSEKAGPINMQGREMESFWLRPRLWTNRDIHLSDSLAKSGEVNSHTQLCLSVMDNLAHRGAQSDSLKSGHVSVDSNSYNTSNCPTMTVFNYSSTDATDDVSSPRRRPDQEIIPLCLSSSSPVNYCNYSAFPVTLSSREISPDSTNSEQAPFTPTTSPAIAPIPSTSYAPSPTLPKKGSSLKTNRVSPM